MSRLINEEKLREDIDNIIIKDIVENLNKKVTGDMVLNLATKIIKCVENQPTAYDKDKVKEELENSRWWTEPTYDEDGYSNDDSEDVIELYTALEIVERGGIDE